MGAGHVSLFSSTALGRRVSQEKHSCNEATVSTDGYMPHPTQVRKKRAARLILYVCRFPIGLSFDIRCCAATKIQAHYTNKLPDILYPSQSGPRVTRDIRVYSSKIEPTTHHDSQAMLLANHRLPSPYWWWVLFEPS